MTTLTRERLSAGATWSRPGALWLVVLSGSATLETAGSRREVGAGDAVLVDARTAHCLVAHAETDLVHGDLRQAVPTVALPSPLVVREFERRQRGVMALVRVCPLDAISAPAPYAASYAGLIGAAMVALWEQDGRAAPDGLGDPQVGDVVAALAARPGEPWTVDRMAALVHLSRSALTERFRRATGHSPMGMLRQVRMDRARTLLADRCLLITRIAVEVGYGSVAAFSRAFAAEHDGVSPLAWRTAPSGSVSDAVSDVVSGARQAHERPAQTRRHRGARADHEQRADAVAVQ
ncbi:helix-turn-helix domain-containing protein [Promicromonospora thailandica]|uniref:AraC-type DNA-binding protein n=1 Tax=Promicromonospora thailandica TaxID=765201 RepID=A0A9X2G0X4_9MICO|nr:AraC family transcriptional regulator [Promicromonospora thailandica]MCP2263217.1 AraC-type DNA-binding protein [Promicromonospora thailandica]BFF18605.1 hypothetical protein GCM10025730_21260 [Promicromonospora thailandica]